MEPLNRMIQLKIKNFKKIQLIVIKQNNKSNYIFNKKVLFSQTKL